MDVGLDAQRFLDANGPTHPLVLCNPINLRYLANFHVDPFSLGGDFGGLLVLQPDGRTKLFHENRLPESVKQAHVDATEIINWYDGHTPGRGPRRLGLDDIVKTHGGHIHDSLASPLAQPIFEALGDLRALQRTRRNRAAEKVHEGHGGRSCLGSAERPGRHERSRGIRGHRAKSAP